MASLTITITFKSIFVMKTLRLLVFLILSTMHAAYGQVQILPESIDIDPCDLAPCFPLNIQKLTRTMRVNGFGHIQLRNAFGENAVDYWQIGARDDGTFDLAYGDPGSGTGVVDSDAALVSFTQGGDMSLVQPSSRINFFSTSGQEATLKYNPSTFELENNTSDGDITLDAADEIKLATGAGSPTRVLIEEDGDVGIGTSGPVDAKLEIRSNSSAEEPHLELYETESNDFARLKFRSLPTSTNRFVIASNPGSGGLMNFFFSDGTVNSNAMSIDGPNQRVGINKTTPEAFLHIRQEGGGRALTIENNGDDNDYWSFEVGTNDLNLYYDADGSGIGNPTLHGRFNAATLGSYTSSDRRLKNDIETLPVGTLQKVLQLNPASYYYNHDRERTKRAFGFIAQEVEEILPELILHPENGEGTLALNYDDFTPLLTKAIQEQQKLIEEKDQRIIELENRLAEMEDLVNRLAEHVDLPEQGENETILLSDAELFQNEPNPFDGRTLIRYRIPDNVRQATLRITNAQGQVIRDLRLEERGAGQVELNTQTLSTGAYQYSLILDGRLLDTKRMILTKN